MITIYRAVLLLLSLTVVFTVQADGFENSVSYQSGWLFISQGDGLVINIPTQETHDVLSQVQKLSFELNVLKNQCAEDVENTQFKTKDAFIAAVMPGGLLYAAHKKQKHAQAKEDLKTVIAQVNGILEDLDFLEVAYSKAVLVSR